MLPGGVWVASEVWSWISSFIKKNPLSYSLFWPFFRYISDFDKASELIEVADWPVDTGWDQFWGWPVVVAADSRPRRAWECCRAAPGWPTSAALCCPRRRRRPRSRPSPGHSLRRHWTHLRCSSNERDNFSAAYSAAARSSRTRLKLTNSDGGGQAVNQ